MCTIFRCCCGVSLCAAVTQAEFARAYLTLPFAYRDSPPLAATPCARAMVQSSMSAETLRVGGSLAADALAAPPPLLLPPSLDDAGTIGGSRSLGSATVGA